MSVSELEQLFANTSGNPIQHAFTRRGGHMPGTAGTDIPVEDHQDVWSRLQAKRRSGPTVMYLHVPFCANHCLFCGFYRNKWQETHSAPYTNALIKELERDASSLASTSGPINAVYFGGGTPTALHAKDLQRLIRRIRDLFPLAADCEIAVEGRIYHFDDDKIEACLDAGANRFSTGVQSFNTQVRRRQGRKATGEEAIRFFEGLRDRNRAAIICDLILGLPDQSADVWLHDLQTVADLGLDGVDLYTLAVFPGSPLSLAIKKGRISPSAPLPEQGLMYQGGLEYLAARGWRQLSSSHWARGTRERNLYNSLLKSGAQCLAFGAGAGGGLNNFSYTNHADLAAYYEQVNLGVKPLASLSQNDALATPLNHLAAGVEAMRIDLAALESNEHITQGFLQFMAPLLDNWRAAQLVEGEAVLTLTTAGRFWHQTLLTNLKAAVRLWCASHQTT
ncbi:heme anaerobic degradation radical SAM methyltransferase ChuW/HutW [Pseudovibrio sp. SPO723]|uniref:heme anaerobic degradation radical SAM methyltransferase ChuW/HutW n=1 Tax=Nesiotobacter zosterae TaxID=392721 RepID=UPI0029C5EBC6|nr:heme anaerobic degradation radical SAM methyltransferase ChuW/HutW [Pseudovibrio sp. SPO723]MDX5592143.1 heme anaerobic degradation radical SAM methyltransferase ChuW/HutW [Pseudovibrio sp. SPO723]